MHPAQVLLHHFKEPQSNYAEMQHYLKLKDAQHLVVLTDFVKAFERVNPWWILECLVARSAPAWIKAYVIHFLFGRRTHEIQGRFLSPITIHQGPAMERATSVVLFCLALDPLVIRMTIVPRPKNFLWIRKRLKTPFGPAQYAGLSPKASMFFSIGITRHGTV